MADKSMAEPPSIGMRLSPFLCNLDLRGLWVNVLAKANDADKPHNAYS
ncbi:MAG: hypothetical protein WD431_24200 [Cyclobacteriaceae bacterium]